MSQFEHLLVLEVDIFGHWLSCRPSNIVNPCAFPQEDRSKLILISKHALYSEIGVAEQ